MMQTIALWGASGVVLGTLINQITQSFDWDVTNIHRFLSIAGCVWWAFCLWGAVSALGVW